MSAEVTTSKFKDEFCFNVHFRLAYKETMNFYWISLDYTGLDIIFENNFSTENKKKVKQISNSFKHDIFLHEWEFSHGIKVQEAFLRSFIENASVNKFQNSKSLSNCISTVKEIV